MLTKFQLIRLNVGLWLQREKLILLIQQQIEQLLATNKQLQILLTWVSQKSRAVITRHKPVTVRAFYFDMALARALGLVGGTLDLARSFEPTLTRNLEPTLALDLALDRVLGLDRVMAQSHNPQQVFNVVLERAVVHARVQEPRLEQALLQLKAMPVTMATQEFARGASKNTPFAAQERECKIQLLPELVKDAHNFKQWWLSNGRVWTEQLRAVSIEYRNLGHNWQFNHQQKEALKQYYNLNCWLVDCLNSSYYTDSQVRAEIELAQGSCWICHRHSLESSLLLPLQDDTRLQF